MGFIVARAKYQQEPAATTTASSTQPELRQQPVATPVSPPPPAESKADSSAQDAAKPPADVAPPARPTETNPEPPPVIAESMQGTYWQVTSTKDPAAARAMLQSMKDMGLPASLSPGPNDFTRVLVGPYTDTATMAKVKTQLENAGLHPVKHIQ
jgi:cell division septation protein DedD